MLRKIKRYVLHMVAVAFNRRVACATCPYWIKHSRFTIPQPLIKGPLETRGWIGICGRAKPEFFTMNANGYGFRAKYADDFCNHHPCFDPRLFADTDLQYNPDTEKGDAIAFNRAPTFEELQSLALRAGIDIDLSAKLPRDFSSLKKYAKPPENDKPQ